MALVVVASSGLLARSLRRLGRVRPGFAPEDVALARVVLPVARYGAGASRAAVLQEVARTLRATPGVRGDRRRHAADGHGGPARLPHRRSPAPARAWCLTHAAGAGRRSHLTGNRVYPGRSRRVASRRAAIAAAAGLVVLAGWLVPRTIAERAHARGPVVGPGVDSAAATRVVRRARLAVAAAQEHPLSRAAAPFHAVTAVWRDPGHCAPDEPGGADADRDYGASVRTIGWFGIPGRVVTVRCGGASWHDAGAAPRRARAAPVVRARHGLTVDGDRFVLRRVGDALHADIPFTYVNARGVPLVVPRCDAPTPPMVQWWTGAEWRSAYLAVAPACSMPPDVLAPGTRHHDTLRLRIAHGPVDAEGRLVEPHWRAPPTATVFRLLWTVHDRAADTLSVGAGPLVPEAARVSASFGITMDVAPDARSGSRARAEAGPAVAPRP